MKSFAAVAALLVVGCQPATPRVAPQPRPDAEPTATIHLIDVGQGAATLLEFPCGAALIDTGGESNHLFDSEKALTEYLERFFARREDLRRTLDLVVLTHPHLDHTRNVQKVAERFVVKNLVTGGDAKGSGGHQQAWAETWAREHGRFEAVRADAIPAGGLTDGVIDPIACAPIDPKISVLWGGLSESPAGWNERAFGNHNNHSVVVRVEHGRSTFLFSGDLEEAGIASMVAKHGPTGALDVDVWQVGHHGSYNATTKPLLDALTPRLALIPMGSPTRWTQWTAWKFGHPRKKALDLLRGSVTDTRPSVRVLVGTGVETFEPLELDRAVYGTGWDGDVVVTASPTARYTVTTAHPVVATIGVPGP